MRGRGVTPVAEAALAWWRPRLSRRRLPLRNPAALLCPRRGCQESFNLLNDLDVSRELAAVCEYGGGTGDVVLLDRLEDAEAECSADGLIAPSRVVAAGRLP
jgi:hypothetical protein